MPTRSTQVLSLALVCALAFSISACRRKDYRESADSQTYGTLQHSLDPTPWNVPKGFTIDPKESSRLFDPSDPDDPSLPHPGPYLFAYEIPELPDLHTSTIDLLTARQNTEGEDPSTSTIGLRLQPIPESAWDAIPEASLRRMFEFESVRREYERRYEEQPGENLRDDSRRLSLPQIAILALLNSREYQAEKEALYLAALEVAREQFDYSLHFTSSGNGTALDYTHARSGGATTQSVSIPTGAGATIERSWFLGTTVLARFANNIVLTFDGPDGWATSIGSELFFQIDQELFQWDAQFESLVQSERDLIYAARDFARFRREFFVRLASSYYALLRTYRSIEIESQNYFSLVRTYEQANAEGVRGVKNAPNPVEIDQFEQGMLSGRSSLISTCNDLERALDNLKLTLGLPTETPINIDLRELDELTLRDEVQVAGERVRRWRNLVSQRRNRRIPDRGDVLNGQIYLLDRILEWLRLRMILDPNTQQPEDLEQLLDRARVDAAEESARLNRGDLQRTIDAGAGSPLVLKFSRTNELAQSLLTLAGLQIGLAKTLGKEAQQITDAEMRAKALQDRQDQAQQGLVDVLQKDEQEGLDQLLASSTLLVGDLDTFVTELFALCGIDDADASADEKLQKTLAEADTLLERSAKLLEDAGLGLPLVDIVEKDALETALVQRVDLMNERGRLGDSWRAIKLAADELRSVVNVGASYSLPTETNKPFDCHDENATGRASLSIDLPLNRRDKRDGYRRALISYQSRRRGLTQLEDSIKEEVRSALRTLAEQRIQYPISVTQAALAAEQVISVKLQLALGVEGVRGTDLLDAQESSRRALTSVANQRIGYIVDRAQLVLDLEGMSLDNTGMWPSINDSAFTPAANTEYPENAGPTYGDLPKGIWISDDIQRIVDQPVPGTRQPGDNEITRVEE